MKILHLTTSRSGGAGVAALRLVEAQKSDPRLEVRVGTPRDRDKSKRRAAIQKKMAFQSKILTGLQQTMARKEIEFVSPLSTSTIDWKYIQDFSPDILHVHNWYNFLSLDDINQLLVEYKVVFTAHDERLLTGGCHITFACDRYEQSCKSCPQVRFAASAISNSADKLQKVLSESENYSIIAPSNWLSEKFRLASFINSSSQVKSIPNLIPIAPKSNLSSICRSDFKFFFVTNAASSWNKGLPEVLEAIDKLSKMNPSMKFHLHIAGTENQNSWVYSPNLVVNFLGVLTETGMQDWYRASDALIVASKSENSPNVISEAQIQGLFVIGHAVGGIPEIVRDQETGLLYESSGKTLLSCLTEFIGMTEEESTKIRISASQSAVSRHELTRVLNETYAVYTELLQRKSK